MEQRRYIITLKSKDDLEEFYHQMECQTHESLLPNRAVECCNRRHISRNTEYLLADSEAEEIRKDSRVLAVERIPEEIGIVPVRLFTQTETTWDKSAVNNSDHKNWGLLRSTINEQIENWGSDRVPSQQGTVRVNAEGRNVDIVVVDGIVDPAHPEYTVNGDGTGASRVVQYNWFQHSLGQASNNYVYGPYSNANATLTADNNHGAHVAGIVAGNTQGWARQSNIYNINPYGSDVNGVSPTLLLDYIRSFHNNKPVNHTMGRRNPTICNHSWGYASILPISGITNIVFRGVVVNGPFTAAELKSYGIATMMVQGVESAVRPARVAAVDADIEDAIADGIIMVGAAGNEGTKIDLASGQDYNNYFVWNGFAVLYHRGSTPGSSGNVVCVGSVSSLADESKSSFSNSGPRVDVYAPGSNIMSSFNSASSYGGVDDPRSSAFKIGKISGTSMASPQVAGVLACVLEIYPNMNQTEAVEYIDYYAKKNVMTSTAGGFDDTTSLQGSTNNYLFYFEERLSNGQIYPKLNYKIRPTNGIVYPRFDVRKINSAANSLYVAPGYVEDNYI